MKKFLSSVLITIASLTSQAAIRDDFNDSTVDPTTWEISLPFSNSGVFESDGNLHLRNRGGLVPRTTFADGIEIRGSFTLSETLDVFKVFIRSDLVDLESQYHEKGGVFFVFWADGRAAHLAHSGGLTLGHVDGAINALGVPTPFRIVDDGYEVSLYLNGSDTPTIAGATTYRRGNRVIFYNRESVGRSFTAQIDYLELSEPCGGNVGPSPANGILLKDEFSTPFVCPNVWRIYNVFENSRVGTSDGRAVLEKFGSLETVNSLPDGIDIRGRFRFSDSSTMDHFKVGIRTDLSRTSPTDYTGVFIGFDKEHNTIGLAEAGGAWLAVSNFNLSVNFDYDFRITDDGKTIMVYVNDMENPLMKVQSTHRTGNRAYLHNREIGLSKVELDFVEIRSLAAVAIYTAVEVEFETEIGRRYQIQISEDMSNWTSLDSPVDGNGRHFKKLYSVRGISRTFYRVQVIE